MATDEKFVNDNNLVTVWDKTKGYIDNNTVMLSGGAKLQLDKTVFGEEPYTLIFTEEEQ